MTKKSLYLIGVLLAVVILNSGSVYAATNENELTVMADDPQAGRESGEMLDGFFDDASNDDLNEDEDPYGISLMSIPYGYTHASKYANYNVINGIDVSYYQGNIDWNAVKADGIDFAIIRVGYRGYGSAGNLKEDAKYAQNIQGALNAGIKVGVYIFSQATTSAEAVEEANFLLSRIGSYNITFPVVLDYEYASVNGSAGGRLYDAHLSKRQATDVCNAFCERVASAGYVPMVYANKSMLRNQMYASEISSKYNIWLANYTYETDYEGDYVCWQYTSSGSINGISGRVDMNFWYDKPNTVYQGIDYSDVYNYDYYMSTYSDLKSAYANDAAGALAHFVNFGMSEGRRGNDEFNVYAYKNRYVDLRTGYGPDLKQYYLHYMYAGKAEGRDATGNPPLTGRVTTYNGIDYSDVYDYDYYISAYSDIRNAYGDDDWAVLQHFVECGMTEGRQACEGFNVYTYRNRYIDLRRGYGNDLKSYYMHYITHGKAEGRTGAGIATFVGETIYNGVDYAAVYNYDFYSSTYPSLRDACNGDENALLQHFVEHGMSEGRSGNATFSVRAYMNRYDDLREGYGNDLKSYYMHFVLCGKTEGRDGSPYNAAYYAAVYDFDTYMSLNPDIQAAFGENPQAALEHFVVHGMYEGRQASEEFNVYAYMNRYADLKSGYGDNLKGYYMHYIQAGQAEGRNGRLEEIADYSAEILLLDDMETEAELEVEPEPDVEAEPEGEVETEVEPEVEVEVETEAEVEPEVETELEVGTDAETETVSTDDAEAGTVMETKETQ